MSNDSLIEKLHLAICWELASKYKYNCRSWRAEVRKLLDTTLGDASTRKDEAAQALLSSPANHIEQPLEMVSGEIPVVRFSDYIEGRVKYLNDYGYNLTSREREEAELAWDAATNKPVMSVAGIPASETGRVPPAEINSTNNELGCSESSKPPASRQGVDQPDNCRKAFEQTPFNNARVPVRESGKQDD